MSKATMRRLVLGVLLAVPLGGILVACGAMPQAPTATATGVLPSATTVGPPAPCVILCPAAPPGCEYRGQILVGSCQVVTCGKLICNPSTGGDPPGHGAL